MYSPGNYQDLSADIIFGFENVHSNPLESSYDQNSNILFHYLPMLLLLTSVVLSVKCYAIKYFTRPAEENEYVKVPVVAIQEINTQDILLTHINNYGAI
jgi:hypothetical protein